MNQYSIGFVFLSLAMAQGASIIGVASTRGAMQVDNVPVRGNANLKDGSQVQTADTASQIRLQNGVQATFEPKTDAAVFVNRIELRQGSGEISATSGFDVNALGHRISPAGKKAVARIALEESDRVVITSVEDDVNVTKGGKLVAKLSKGMSYQFGPDDDNQVGGGTVPPAAGKINPVPGSAAKGAGVKTGLSTAAKVGIGGGAAAAGTGVGLGVALSGKDASR